MEALLAVSELQVPNALINEEAARLAAEMKQNFINQGMADAKTWICRSICLKNRPNAASNWV